MKTFVHTRKEGLLLAVAVHIGLALLIFVITSFRWAFGAGEMTFAHAAFTVAVAPSVASLLFVSAYWWASRHSVVIDQDQVVTCYDGEVVERRSIHNFRALEQSTFGHPRNRMTFQGEPDLPIKGLNGLKLHALSRYIQEITQRNERNRNEVRKEPASPHAS